MITRATLLNRPNDSINFQGQRFLDSMTKSGDVCFMPSMNTCSTTSIISPLKSGMELKPPDSECQRAAINYESRLGR